MLPTQTVCGPQVCSAALVIHRLFVAVCVHSLWIFINVLVRMPVAVALLVVRARLVVVVMFLGPLVGVAMWTVLQGAHMTQPIDLVIGLLGGGRSKCCAAASASPNYPPSVPSVGPTLGVHVIRSQVATPLL